MRTFLVRGFWSALQFLTRLPVPRGEYRLEAAVGWVVRKPSVDPTRIAEPDANPVCGAGVRRNNLRADEVGRPSRR